MVIIELNEEELNNLKLFMERVTLNGKEVPAYLAIMKKLFEGKKLEE